MAKTIDKVAVLKYRRFNVSEGAKIYTALRAEVIKKGLLDRSYGFYILLTLFTYCGFLASFFAVYVSQNLLLFLLFSLSFTFFSVQIGGLVHDAGHRAIFKSPKYNDLAGHFFATTVGLAFHNWRVNHDRHHANPNEDGSDPDIEVPFSFTDERIKKSAGLAKFIRRYQAYAYYPLGSLAGFTVRFKRLNYFSENWGPKIYGSLIVFVLGVVLYFTLPLFLMGIGKGLAFLIIVNLVGGFYLFNIFAPNHKGMPELEKGVELSFLEQQIITARNVSSSPLVDYVYLGLNFQIEHHLFPNTPRNKLKKVAVVVKKMCRKYKLEYTETGVLESNAIIFKEMQSASKALVS